MNNKNPNSKIKSSLKYLVENDSDSNSESIISEVSQLTLIDPAAGSGHILVEGFDLLYQMYMEEYYTPEEAVESILKKNLFGLDIDDRAAQLANFAILLKAAKQYRDVFTKSWLPNVYAMPEYATFSEQEIQDFLGTNGADFEKELKSALRLMEQAKNLGSVMKLNLSDEARAFLEKRFEEIKNSNFRDINTEIVYQKIKSFIPVLLILSKKYSTVVANPPYMGQVNMNSELKDYINANYPETKSDLMTVFMEVIPNMTLYKSRFALINLPSWLFLSSFETLRKSYIDNYQFDSLLHMGRGVFGIDFGSVAFSMKKDRKENSIGSYFRLHERNFQHILYQDIEKLFLYSNGKSFYKYDFNQYRGEDGIAEIPKQGSDKGQIIFYPNIPQSEYLKIPGFPIAYWVSKQVIYLYENQKQLFSIADVKVGMDTGDNSRFLRYWFEISFRDITFNNKDSNKWIPYNKGGEYRKWYGNQEYVLFWENNGKDVKNFTGSNLRSQNLQGNSSISWSLVASKGFGVRAYPVGFYFDNGGRSIFSTYNNVLIGFLNSIVASKLLNVVNPTINVQVGNVGTLPIVDQIINQSDIESLCNEAIDISKKDWDSRETSWHFSISPLISEMTSISGSYFHWLNMINKIFIHLYSIEEKLNRIFIDWYGLQNEMNASFALKDITILQEELIQNDLEALDEKFKAHGKGAIELPIKQGEVISQFISYAVGLFMGRYRLDKPGLNIAHPNPTKEELSNYHYNHGEVTIDQDAILPIMGKNCNFNDDILKQFTQLLDTIWGHEQRTENINFIQECLDKDLEKFIVNDFWKYHCDMYKKTPIYWLFSSKKGAFQVLVYMHRMNEFTVEKIRANYLLEHLKYLKSEIAQKEANASNLSTAEAKRLDKLRNDLRECEQYDMALKNVADQQIKFDLNDGVSKNYELFETVVAKIK